MSANLHPTAMRSPTQNAGTFMQGSDFLLWSMGRSTEHLAVKCGGYRRANSSYVTGPDNFAFAFMRGGRLTVRFKDAAHQSTTDVPTEGGSTTICPAHHGREVHDCCVLPASDSNIFHAPFEAVSASEDGELRSLLVGLRQERSAGVESCQRCRIGTHVAGSAIRCIAAVRLPREYSVANAPLRDDTGEPASLHESAGMPQLFIC